MITELEPRHVWNHFDKIRSIPRPSKHEQKIREHLLAWARERGFETRVDKVGNKYVSAVVKTYPNVSQFWTYNKDEFLKSPVYSRDNPPARYLEK